MKRMQPMTDEQLDGLHQTAIEAGPRERAIVTLMTRHFIRASELAGTDREGNPTGLRVSDITSSGNRTLIPKSPVCLA
jgi:hypothetical protein